MNIVAKKSILMDYLNVVQRAIPNKGIVQAMEGVLIKATEDGELEFSTTNGEFSIVASAVKCDTWEPGAVVLPSKFINVVKLMPSEMVKIEASPEEAERFRINVSSGDSSFTLAGIDPNIFPSVTQDAEGVYLQVLAKDIKELLNNTLFAASPQSHNPIFEGVLFEVKDNKLYVMASDTYRVAIDSIATDAEDFKAIVPAKTLAEINKIITEPDEIINCFVSEKELKWGYKDFVISSRLLAGEYPNFLEVFPETHKTMAITKTAELRELVARALLIDHKIIIETNDLFHISAMAQDGKMEETLETEITGEDLKIFLNAHYINDVLRVLDNEKIIIEFNGPLGPCVIKVPSSNYRYLVLPIRQ